VFFGYHSVFGRSEPAARLMLTPKRTRIFAIFTAATLAAPLLLAASLSPAKDGLGTHQQLGLPPCSTRVLLGIRCPACGMTTSWAHFMSGQWRQSAATNLGGFLLAWMNLATIGICLAAAGNGRLPSQPVVHVWSLALIGIAVVTASQWGWRVL